MEIPEEEKDNRLFIPRENGSGWNLGFNNNYSYWILALILALPFAVIILIMWLK